ncbi:MAG: PDZ domain-containing protein, partial [bacterium]|nr:PDZ domain-containing protein [bacterium]
AGLEPGDRLLRINDTPILNRRRFRELERTFWGGQRVNVTYRSASDQQERDVEVKTGARPHDQWLKKGYHGLSLAAARDGIGAVIASVAPESPAAGAGCRAGDVIRQINGNDIARLADAQQLLGDVFSGETCRVTALRDGQTTHIEWTAHRPTDSPWISGDVSKSGGWVYYPKVRGGTTFLSSDILRILL